MTLSKRSQTTTPYITTVEFFNLTSLQHRIMNPKVTDNVKQMAPTIYQRQHQSLQRTHASGSLRAARRVQPTSSDAVVPRLGRERIEQLAPRGAAVAGD